jgi:hypothetical protein
MDREHSSEAGETALQAVYSRQRCIGFLLSRGKLGFEAFGANEKSLGIFPNEKAAADAISEGTP